MKLNLPNLLTLGRIVILPILVIVYYLPVSWAHPAASILFILAAVTDWFDGYIARHWHLTTAFGAFLDPVADKLLVTTALVLIVSEHQLHYLAVPAAIIVGREIVISALREWMAEIGRHMSMAVNWMGKVKTTVQMIALAILLWASKGASLWFVMLGEIMLYVAAVLTLWSMLIYIKVAWRDLTLARESQ